MAESRADGEEELELTQRQADLLDALAELEIRSPYQRVATPPRTSSRTSTSPRVSPRSSNHSLRSTSSAHGSFRSSLQAAYQRSTSSLSRALQREVDDAGSASDNDTTPSLHQAGFISPSSSSFRPDDISPKTPIPFRSGRADQSASDRSSAGSSFRGNLAGPATVAPLRLLARPPRNEVRPGDDLAMFRELEAMATPPPARPEEGVDEIDALSLLSGRSSALSTRSLPRSSSLRVNRLRKDIEFEANRLREKASLEEMRRDAEAASVLEQRFSSDADRPSTPASNASLPLLRDVHRQPSSHPVSELPSQDCRETASPASSGRIDADSKSYAAASRPSLSARPAGISSMASLSIGEADNDRAGSASARGGGSRHRPRPREAREWTQTCWLWSTEASDSRNGNGTSSGRFSKTPLLKEVPNALKRKNNKRDSAPHLSPAEAALFGGSASPGSSSLKSKERKKDREKHGSNGAPADGEQSISASNGPAAPSVIGRWKRISAVLRDDGLLRLYDQDDQTILSALQLASKDRFDIRLVDHSLFGRPHCISVRHGTSSVPTTPYLSASFASSSARDQLYLCLPSLVASQVWFTMMRCFARPESLSSHDVTSSSHLSRGAHGTQPDELLLSDSENDDVEVDGGDQAGTLASAYRIVRSVNITINEGRGLGQRSLEAVRSATKASWDRPVSAGGDTESTTSSLEHTSHASPARSASSFALNRLPGRASTDDREEPAGHAMYSELVLDGAVVAQSSKRRAPHPFWNESFVLNDLPPLLEPATIRVLQGPALRPRLLGTAEIRLPDIARQKLVEQWLPVRPAASNSADSLQLGELSVGVRISEDAILPAREYAEVLRLLVDDDKAELAAEIANNFTHELEDTTRCLVRIFSTQSILLDRIQSLTEHEIATGVSQNRSAALLFRGNTVLTKSIELYLRLVGAEYLDASIGDIVRRICKEKPDVEMDPLKASGAKEKELAQNARDLQEWTKRLWQGIFIARDKCPHDLRLIFHRLQAVVTRNYSDSEERENTRWTCISAFLFLRFFVPAVLNPRLFNLVPSPPDSKSQRALTLVAKSLQGLANFSTFGQKELWMRPMNSFVEESTPNLVVFLEHVSTPVQSSAHRQEWTSPNAAVYVAPNRLKESLPAALQEGIPLLPHLIDLPRELASLASRLSRHFSSAGVDTSHRFGGRSTPPADAERLRNPSPALRQLVAACATVDAEARRRGGGLSGQPVTPISSALGSHSPAALRARGLSGRPATVIGMTSTPASLRFSPARPKPVSKLEERHQGDLPPTLGTAVPIEPRRRREESAESTTSASRRLHRSYTISGAQADFVVLNGGQTEARAFPNAEVRTLASLDTVADLDDVLANKARVQGAADLASALGNACLTSAPVRIDNHPAPDLTLPKLPRAPGPNRSPPQDDHSFRVPQSGPSPRTIVKSSRRPPPPISTDLRLVTADQPRPATARIRITQETVTTETYLADPLPLRYDPVDARPVETRSTGPELKSKSHGWSSSWTGFGTVGSVRSLASSPSLANITSSAVVSSGATTPIEKPSTAELAIRRASSAGIVRPSRSSPVVAENGKLPSPSTTSPAMSREGSSGRSQDGRSGTGFLSRALGRKGTRAN